MSGTGGGIGQRPENNKQRFVKLLWTGIWLVYLSAPASDLLHGGHSTGVRILGWIGLAAFVTWYVLLLFRTGRGARNSVVLASLGVLAAQSTVLALTLGREWLVLFVYVSIASGAALPPLMARWTIPGASALMTVVALATPGGKSFLAGLLIPALLGGFAMTGVRELVRTTVALREARATVAQLAANEERLRLARDLHDLLGHSLSLITLKSELAGRMLPDHPDKAARQVADIEQVSRQALVDVREAVTGYRRPRLAAELAGAKVALTAAGVAAALPVAEPDLTGIAEDSETALAWALREAITNVVRHSGAGRCTVELLRRQTLDGPVLELSVEDNGSGEKGDGPGNGLTGLTERLEKAGGTLDAGGTRHGFRLTARVPVTAAATAVESAP
ncbi:sensor histidine kinase [Streptomyces viridochromogenes]|uniref:sensor histidine kinase n=1 Tax=Streptomyces viridochromogenes TaxID=1938 RepID=UPI00069DDA4D|nr:sensor histidine kinase [Streptomyces viridochromogenes]KOG08615.1 histidine kinase [Streptomyces viridochromogenes]KOG08708.1 histidine kinase [Streptomyces viridochromogenes]